MQNINKDKDKKQEICMARISGVDLPKNKRIEISLTYIYGLGLSSSQEILKKTNINPDIPTYSLNDEQIIAIRDILNNEYQVEGDLKRLKSMNIKRLVEISCYRGRRHQIELPIRGQRTRTNARTRRGKAKNRTSNKKFFHK